MGIKKDRQLFADCDQSTVSFSVFSFSNLLEANGLSKPFADGKSTRDSRISGARGGVATLTERSDATFPVGQFSSADRE